MKVNNPNPKYLEVHEYSFENGVQIDDDKLENWVNRVINYLRANPKDEFMRIASGNSMVIGYRWEEEPDIIHIAIIRNGYIKKEYCKEDKISELGL